LAEELRNGISRTPWVVLHHAGDRPHGLNDTAAVTRIDEQPILRTA